MIASTILLTRTKQVSHCLSHRSRILYLLGCWAVGWKDDKLTFWPSASYNAWRYTSKDSKITEASHVFCRPGLLKKTAWALYEKKEFDTMLEEVTAFVNARLSCVSYSAVA
jgi:hypothetical protein